MDVIRDCDVDICWVIFIGDYDRIVCDGNVVNIWFGLSVFDVFYGIVKIKMINYYC